MRDRRLGQRIPLDVMLTCYVADRPLRALVLDVSDTGLHIEVVAGRAPAPGTAIQLELTLPGVSEPLWIAGSVRYQRGAKAIASGLGVRFVAMAQREARALRDFCVESRHQNLAQLLARVTQAPPGLARYSS